MSDAMDEFSAEYGATESLGGAAMFLRVDVASKVRRAKYIIGTPAVNFARAEKWVGDAVQHLAERRAARREAPSIAMMRMFDEADVVFITNEPVSRATENGSWVTRHPILAEQPTNTEIE